MTIKELIQKLEEYNPELPVCINDYMGFVEMNEESIKVEKKNYICFPFTETDKFEYVNLKSNET
jgi:hypothetical protein